MTKLILPLLIFILSFQSFSQEKILNIKAGDFSIFQEFDLNITENNNYRILFFDEIPTNSDKGELQKLGVTFLEYLPKNIFVVSIQQSVSSEKLKKYKINSVNKISPEFKIDPKLQNNTFPDWTMKNGKLFVKVLLYKNVIISDKIEELRFFSSSIEDVNEFSHSVLISINPENLNLISNLDYVFFIEPIDPPSDPENKTARTLHRSNVINTNFSSGRYYDGTGINVMMQDDGMIGPHIDYQGRIDQSNCGGCSTSFSNDHGDHVAGTIMGSGNLDPIAAGMANGAFLYVYSSSNNNYYDVPTIYQNNDVIITSKSYSNGCNAGYTSLAEDLDEQINLYPSLIHVFSAGNNGSSDCGYGAGSGWGNVTGGHKQAKNVIAVANLTSISGLAGSSSRGPAADGRIKPDIGAKGTSVNSTIPENDYGLKTGTSMSCPGIAGVMAQIYQAYKDLNGGQNPSSALMKCILLNSADDIGNPGPDFKTGWGEVNVFRAVKMIESNQYFSDTISQLGANIHTINIPAGVEKVKIMTYWHDKEASTTASIALVNDINTNLTFPPLGTVYLPWVLDETPTSAALNSVAVPGIDNLNNMEQITIDNPIQGVYSLSISGFAIPYGPQEYWVTYEFITDDITLTYPIGGEGLVPGELEAIRWDASEGITPFLLEYTTDGISWNIINASVSQNVRYCNWTVPNSVTDLAKVRITRGTSSDESVENFTIVGVPQNVVVDWICPDSIYVFWNAVSGATEYEVNMLGNRYMDSMTTTVNAMGLILNPNPSNIDSWFSVCAKVNGNKGRRAVAVNDQPTNVNCVAPPVANFSILSGSSCSGNISFTDASLNQPSNWLWDFGDGTTSNLQNPLHTYLQQGTYDVSLLVSNALGQDSILQTSVITISFLSSPIAYNDTSYVNPATFSLVSAASDVQWYSDTLGSAPIFYGTPFITPLLTQNTTYYVRENGGNFVNGGVLDTSIGAGDYYYGNRHLIFDSYVECKLISADVYAQQVNTITFELRNSSGVVLQDTTITISTGKQTLYFNFDVPIATGLQLGLNATNSSLFRNNSGAVYPYPIGNLVSFTGASNTSTQDNWYNYYNLEFKENCLSQFAEATAVFIDPSSVEDNSSSIDIYPNPATHFITIENNNRIKNITILDIQSRVVYSEKVNSERRIIDVSHLSNGVYIVEVSTSNTVIRKEFVISNENK